MLLCGSCDLFVIGNVDLLDIRAETLELGDHIGVASLDIADVGDIRLTLRDQSGDHHRRAGTQVGRLDGGAGQLTSLDDGESTLYRDPRTHAYELADILIAVVPYALVNDGGTLDGRQQRHELGLTVGREARMGHSLDIYAVQRTLGRVDDDRLIVLFDLTAHLTQLGADALEVLGRNIADSDLSAGRGGSRHISAGLDLIRDDRISHAAQIIYAADLDDVGTGAADVGAHRVEEVRQIDDMRLLSGILEDRLTLRLDGGKHQVDGRADGNGIEVDTRAVEGTLCTALDDSAVDEVVLRAHQRKALKVLVDRTNTEVTAAGKGDLGVMKTSEQRAQKVVGRTHAAHVLADRLISVDGSGVDIERVLIDAAHHRAHILEDRRDQGDVGDIRYILDAAGLVTEHHGGDNRDRRVLGAADGDFTVERFTAVDYDLFQSVHFLYKSSVI